MYVSAPDAARLPLVRAVEVDLEPGRHGVHRAQRAGQDQPGRGDRLPVAALLAPGRHRRAAGARRCRAGDRARRIVQRRATGAWSSWRSTRARRTARGSTGRRCPGPATLVGAGPHRVFSPEDLALVKGDPSDRRRFLDDLLVLRTPRLAGVRADYERVLKQRNTLLKTAGAGAARPTRRRCPVAPSTCGTTTSRRRGAELLAARLAPGRRAARRTSARRTRRSPAEPRATRGDRATSRRSSCSSGPDPERAADAGAARGGRAPPQRRARPRHLPGRSPPRRAAVLHPRRPAAARLPVRATPPTGSRGRSRSRCGWRRTTCCARTATTRC